MTVVRVKLKEILRESKVESITPDVAKRLRVRLNCKGVEKRPDTNDKAGATKYYMRRSGQFIYGRQNLHKGAFGVVPEHLDGFESSADIPAFDIHTSCKPEWIELFLKQGGYYLQLKTLASGVGSQRISPSKFLSLEMPLPGILEQEKALDKVRQLQNNHTQLDSQLTFQQNLLKKLRQQILQEAIEGKLTANWRATNASVEPANELLKRITVARTELVKTKKLKKQNSLPPISDKEKIFDLPEGWEWCRLGDYALFERGRFSIRPRNDPSCFGGKFPFIQIGSLNDSGSLVTEFNQSLNEKGFKASKLFKKGTIMIAIVGGTIGNLGVLGKDMCFPDSIVGVQPMKETSQDYILLILRYFRPYVLKLSYQMAGQPNIKLPTLNNLVFALPSLSEQQVIVTKVQRLLTICDQLEAQITKNKTHADALMQAVLRETFIHTSEERIPTDTQRTNNIVSFKSEGIDYYKRTLLSAEIVHQLYKEPTLGHLKLQKLIFLCQKTQGMELPMNFLQQAAGPYDPKMARSIDKQLREKSWFEYKKNELNKYHPLDNAGSHKDDFEKYFASDLSAISHIINLFRKARSEEMEAVATLYACWEEILKTGAEFTNDLLIRKFYAWSDEKRKFPEEQLEKYISWMIDHGVCPSSAQGL